MFCIKLLLVGESISEIGFSGQRSFLLLNPIEMETSKFHIEMELRIFRDEGVLFYMEKSLFNFVCLSLMGGVMELRIQTGKKQNDLFLFEFSVNLSISNDFQVLQ